VTPDRARALAASTAFLRWRPWIVAPVMATTLVLLTHASVPARQRAALALGFSAMLAFFVVEAVRARRSIVSERALLGSMVITELGIGVACAASGGLAGPLLPMLLAPTVVGLAAFGRRRGSGVVLGVAAAVLLGLVSLPVGVPFAALAPELHRPIALLATATAVVLAGTGAITLGDAYGAARADTDAARDAAVEAALERSRAVATLGAQVAHEIKNPLASIQGLAELLAEDEREPRAEKRLAVMIGEIARIESIVKDYLTYARPLAAEASPIDLRALVDRVLAGLEGRAARAGVSLTATGSASIVGDAPRLEEAILNVVLNAIEAGGRSVRVAISGSGPVQVEVVDDGPGMADETLARLGTPFFTTRARGTGLGVVLARQVAEHHQGTLSFVSREGQGTTAVFTLGAAP